MAQRTILIAEAGMVLTDGERYASIVYLAEGDAGTAWQSITREEYEARITSPEAETADYRAALESLGVKV